MNSRKPQVRSSRVIGFVAVLSVVLLASLYLSSRPRPSKVSPVIIQESGQTGEVSLDAVPYLEIEKIPTTVCSVVQNPTPLVAKTVVFDASVESDCRHLTLLVDNSCNRGLRFSFPDSVDPQWQPIGDVLCVAMRPRKKQIYGRFTGRLVRDEDTQDGRFPYHVELSSIQEVKIN